MPTLGIGDYFALWLLIMVGIVLIWAGMTGRPGDILAALVSPADLQDQTNGTAP